MYQLVVPLVTGVKVCHSYIAVKIKSTDLAFIFSVQPKNIARMYVQSSVEV